MYDAARMERNQAAQLDIGDISARATITVEDAAQLLGIGRSAAYEAARRGDIPTLRIGRRVLVPVPRLLALLSSTN
jgi:excisionase family DNA binding protein